MDAILNAGFDRHKSICYQGITKLFWDQFPYKVFVRHPRLVRPDTKKLDPIARYEKQDQYETKRKAFIYNRQAHCPKDRSTWKMVSSSHETAFSFYFMHEADALHFIENSKSYVKVVHRPDNPVELVAMARERTSKVEPVVRDMLFWNQYRWQIKFKRNLAKDQQAQIDEFVRETYQLRSNGTRRSRLQQRIYYDSHYLYAHHENDVMLTMLGVSEYIAKITKALLKEEIYEY